MKYTIQWVENKGVDWKLLTLDLNGKALKDVSVNRLSKKGEVFPDFDNLQAGREVEGELWTSPSNKNYLFPPKEPKTGQGGGYKAQLIEKAQDRKKGDIEQFQGQKEASIKQASAQRDAVLIVTTFYKSRWEGDQLLETELDSIIKRKVIEYRDWFLAHDFTDIIPF